MGLRVLESRKMPPDGEDEWRTLMAGYLPNGWRVKQVVVLFNNQNARFEDKVVGETDGGVVIEAS
jgi:hypothetical protein